MAKELTPAMVAALRFLSDKKDDSRGTRANFIGQWLSRQGVLKNHSAGTSNLCLAGGSVLRACERRGYVYRSREFRGYADLWYIADEGLKKLGEIDVT